MRNFLTKLNDDCRGVAIVELALYAPILATLTIGVVDISNAFSRKLALEQAAQRAIERVMQTTADTTAEETIKQEASEQANVPEDQVTVTYRLECDSVAQTDFEGSCTVTQDEARYLMVNVTDVYRPMFPLHFSGYSSADQGYRINAMAGMRTQ